MQDAYEQGLVAGRLDKKLGNSYDPSDRNPYPVSDLKYGAFINGYDKGYHN